MPWWKVRHSGCTDKLLNPLAQERSRSTYIISPLVGVTVPQGRHAHQMQRKFNLELNLVDTFIDIVKYYMDFCPTNIIGRSSHHFTIFV